MEPIKLAFDVTKVQPGTRVCAEVPYLEAQVVYYSGVYVVGEHHISQGNINIVLL